MEENEKINYFAIIPATVRYDNKICANAKLLYGEITALCNEKGFCWAGNEYFARLYKTTKITVSRWIKQLKDRGYIKVQMFYKKDSKEIDKRIIGISNQYPINKNDNTPINKNDMEIGINKNDNTPYQNCYTPINKNVKENNTILINNINNNIYSRVIEYLNQKTSKNFKTSTKKTHSLIQAKLNEGFEYKDFVKVIDTKTKEWKNDKQMNKYLRPETLFGTKFEGYLNETATEQNQQQEEKDDDILEEYKELRKRFGGEPR
jgi:uncharacterized phage protein (TIGR02220 family)